MAQDRCVYGHHLAECDRRHEAFYAQRARVNPLAQGGAPRQSAEASNLRERVHRASNPQRFMRAERAADYLSEQVRKGEVKLRKPPHYGPMVKTTRLG